jgi:hypothetical protein
MRPNQTNKPFFGINLTRLIIYLDKNYRYSLLKIMIFHIIH